MNCLLVRRLLALFQSAIRHERQKKNSVAVIVTLIWRENSAPWKRNLPCYKIDTTSYSNRTISCHNLSKLKTIFSPAIRLPLPREKPRPVLIPERINSSEHPARSRFHRPPHRNRPHIHSLSPRAQIYPHPTRRMQTKSFIHCQNEQLLETSFVCGRKAVVLCLQ